MLLSTQNLKLFDLKTERIFLITPLILIFLIPVELIFFGQLFNKFEGVLYSFILNVIFFNTTHVALTYLMLLRIPEFKKWIFDISNGKPALFWGKVCLLFLFFFFAFFLPVLYKTENSVYLFVMTLIGYLPLHHAVFQVRGLSFCYNQELKKNVSDPNVINLVLRSEKFEKNGFYLLFASLIYLKLFKTYFLKTAFGSQYLFFFNSFYWVTVSLSLVLILKALYLIPSVTKSNKPVYLLRLIAFPLAGFSFAAATATTLLHGLEYVCICSKINHQSKQGPFLEKKLFSLALVVLSVFGLFYLYVRFTSESYQKSNEAMPFFLSALNSVIIALVFVHYYLDRNLYRMRDKVTRENISPLLISN